MTTSGPEVPLTAEQRARLNDLLDPANLLHRACGRRIAEHPYPHLVQVVCPFPPLPPVELVEAPRHAAPADPPCDCGHEEDDHLHLFTTNRCTCCDCGGYEPA